MSHHITVVTMLVVIMLVPVAAQTQCNAHAQCDTSSMNGTFCDNVGVCAPCSYCLNRRSINGICPDWCPDNQDCDEDGLTGRHLRVALYWGETASCSSGDVRCNTTWQEFTRGDPAWTGYDVELLEVLAQLGGFNYTIVNLGSSDYIDDYTALAYIALGIVNNTENPAFVACDIMGQSSWRTLESRVDTVIWSVSMLSEDVHLVGAAARRVTKSFTERATLIFSPFTVDVWLCIVGSICLAWIVLLKLAKRRKYTSEEISDVDLLHYSCMSIIGQGEIDHSRASIRMFSVGWLIFGFLVAEIYAANLTAILGEAPETSTAFVDLNQIIQDKMSFCVQQGAANDIYFTYHKSFGKAGLRIKRVSSITDQINQVSNSFTQNCALGDATSDCQCTSAELTREDITIWQNANPDIACNIEVIGSPLVRRFRGMMALPKNACLIQTINNLFHSLGIRNCTGTTNLAKNPIFVTANDNYICDHRDLYQAWFPDPQTCVSASLYTQEALGVEDLTAVFLILIIMMILGAVGSWLGERYRKWPGIRHCSATESAYEKREAILKDIDADLELKVTVDKDYCCGREIRRPIDVHAQEQEEMMKHQKTRRSNRISPDVIPPPHPLDDVTSLPPVQPQLSSTSLTVSDMDSASASPDTNDGTCSRNSSKRARLTAKVR